MADLPTLVVVGAATRDIDAADPRGWKLGGGVTYAQPNAGQPRLEAGETIYEETPEHFAAVVATYPALGAGIVGGCCGTPPAAIAALAAALGR